MTKSLLILACVFFAFGILKFGFEGMGLTRALAPVLLLIIVLAPIFIVIDLFRSRALRFWNKQKRVHSYPASTRHQQPPRPTE